jgi:hypothetical protein
VGVAEDAGTDEDAGGTDDGNSPAASPSGWREWVGVGVFLAVLGPSVTVIATRGGPTYSGVPLGQITSNVEGTGRFATDVAVTLVELVLVVLASAAIAAVVRSLLYGRFGLSIKTPVGEASWSDVTAVRATKDQTEAVEALAEWVASLDERLQVFEFPVDDADETKTPDVDLPRTES